MRARERKEKRERKLRKRDIEKSASASKGGALFHSGMVEETEQCSVISSS